ncbi:GNAT family N-acetyltransferase [Kitasatospora sp. NPDC058201]|uniref:GNAT family N-acetyltransferase n=1 Tax=unclassified Kitasatospora TaxID=2633591 RepID=UPI0036607A46
MSSSLRLRPATLTDFDAIADLIRLIDLQRRAEDLAPILEIMQGVLATGRGGIGPFTHGSLHILVADHAAIGTPIGLVRCGIGKWVQSLALPTSIPRRLYERIGNVQELAVAPEFRGQGIARALLSQAEEDHRKAGYDAVVLRHHREQTPFYRAMGYTSGSRLTLALPGGLGKVSIPGQGWRWAVKPVAPAVEVADIYGSPTLTGILALREGA